MSLSRLFDEVRRARKAHEWLLPMLLDELSTSREVEAPKHDSWFSVSRVPLACPRAMVMISRLGLPMSDIRTPHSRWTADRGTAMHIVLRDLWLGPMGWLRGGWACPHCSYLHGGENQDRWSIKLSNSVTLPKKCERCDKPWRREEPFTFIEPFSVHPDPLLVRGRNDGFLMLPACGVEVWDLKSTTRLDLVREKPKPDHVEQLQWYLDYEKLRSGRIVYVDPGAKRLEDAMVEHRVSFDAELMHRQKEKVRGIREALRDPEKAVPRCPTRGEGPYGKCDCVEVEDVWARSGH